MATPDDAELGKLTRELRESRERLARLKRELALAGAEFVRVGQALQNSPELIQLGPGGFTIDQLPHVVNVKTEPFNLVSLGERIGEYRRLSEGLPRLEETLRSKGGLV